MKLKFSGSKASRGVKKKIKKNMNANTLKTDAKAADHAHFLSFVRKDYGEEVAANVKKELSGCEDIQAAEADALAKVLAKRQRRVFAMTQSFSSTPLPMEYDSSRRRR